jgi:YcaO-like protein with predicted kinase domain
MATSASVWLPFELVHVNYAMPQGAGCGHFLLSSNGLASGNTFEEAVSHALGEVIERDASALFAADSRLLDERQVDIDSIDDLACRAIIENLRTADFAVAIWDMTSDIGVAAFRCQIMERPTATCALPQPSGGEGCDPRRAIALLRAISEAAQARLSVIAGVRDDIGPDMYGYADDPQTLERWWHFLTGLTGRRRFDAIPDRRCTTAHDEIAFLMEQLRCAGLSQTIVVNLTPEEIDTITVVRVVVPGLEAPPEADCLPGQRLRSALENVA